MLAEQGIEPIDLVCVDLYPFTSAAARRDRTEAEIVELIDVGGPTMLRAAAKNFAHVAAVSATAQYGLVLDELRAHGEVTLATAALARERGVRDERRVRGGDRALVRRQRALPRPADADVSQGRRPRLRREPAPVGRVLRRAGRPQAPALARRAARRQGALVQQPRRPRGRPPDQPRSSTSPAAVIVKHANPCGVAVAATIEEAWERALAADPVSAFGCVVVLNRPVGAELGARIADALRRGAACARLRRRRGRGAAGAARRCASSPTRSGAPRRRASATSSASSAACCCSSATSARSPATRCASSAASPSEEQWADLLFAWTVCKHVSSNAIVIAKGRRTIGIGAGQMSRVDAVRIALENARGHGHDLAGASLASDAFFPFADGPAAGARGRRDGADPAGRLAAATPR